MAEIISIAPQAPQESAVHRRVRAASRVFEILFWLLFLLTAAVLAIGVTAALAYRGDMLSIGPANAYLSTDGPPQGAVAFGALPLGQRLAYGLVAVVRTAPAIILFWSLRGLFRLYARGAVFGPKNALMLKVMGACLIADAAAPFLCHLFLSATGYEIDHRWMHVASLQELVLGGVVFVIALVMQVGREIEEDREYFV